MHLFAVVHTIQALLEKCLKNKLSKYSRVGSCFDDLDTRNTMLQSEFILDIPSGIYGFFYLKHVCMWMMSLFCLICMHTHLFLLVCAKQSYLLGWIRPIHRTTSSGDGAMPYHLKRHTTAPQPKRISKG